MGTLLEAIEAEAAYRIYRVGDPEITIDEAARRRFLTRHLKETAKLADIMAKGGLFHYEAP